MRSRQDRRRALQTEDRMGLLEDDVDDLERESAGQFASLNEKIESMRKIQIGVLVSLTTASVLLAINLALTGLQP